MKFDTKTIFSLFIAVLMVGSIVGFTAFYSFPDQDQGPGDGDVQPLPATAIAFVAENVTVTIDQLLPTMGIRAETSETDLVAINTSIYGIEGIKRVSAGFEQEPYTLLGTGFVYVAEISFDSDLNIPFVLEKLEDETSLQYIDGYTFALVELPSSIEMQSRDEALGLSQTYEFSENISEAMVGFDAVEGDQLNVSISATFIGNDATNIMAFEEENITAATVEKSIVLEAEIDSLESVLLFEAPLPYSSLDSLLLLEEKIAEINDVNNAVVFMSEVEAIISVSGEGIEESKFSELEIFVNDFNAVSVSIENQPLKAEFFFEEIASSSFLEKKALLEAKLEELEIDAVVEETKGLLSGQAEFDSANSALPSEELLALLESKGLVVEIIQPGELAVQELLDPEDSEISYPVPTGLVQAMLKTGHSVGDTANAKVDYVLARGIVQSAQAVEE